MKKSFKYLIALHLFMFIILSCNINEPTSIQPIALSAIITNTTDNSFDVSYDPVENVTVYYAIDRSDEPAPNLDAIIRMDGENIVNEKIDLVTNTIWTKTFDNGIYGFYTYSVYSVTVDSLGIASEITKTDITTPDTMNPLFDRPNSLPEHNIQPGTNSPFTTVTLAFSEPVFYQGGDITFNGFFSGRNITVNNPANVVSNGITVTIAVHGTFAPDDAIVVGWGQDTFKDNSGKSHNHLTGVDYYFWTRSLTVPEKAQLTPGEYNYSIVFYGGLNALHTSLFTDNPGLFLPTTGTFEITIDPSDPTGHTFKGINLFSGYINLGLNEPQTLPVIYSDNPTILGEFNQILSVINFGQETYWVHHTSVTGANPGSYDFLSGNITAKYTLFEIDNSVVDHIDYIYNRIGTYARGSMNEAIQKSKEVKAANPTRVATNPTLGF